MTAQTYRPAKDQVIKLAFVRILIASFFVAIAVGLIPYPPMRGMTDHLMPSGYSIVVSSAFVFVTSFAIMVGRNVRSASLLLAAFLFLSNTIATTFTTTSQSLDAFWLNTVLVAVLLLVGFTRPGGSKRLRLIPSKIKPRRVQINAKVRKPATDAKIEDAPAEPTFASSRSIPAAAKKAPTLRLVHKAEDKSVVEDATSAFPARRIFG